jgi:uncharacterized protein
VKVVCDASALIALSRINSLSLLQQQFTQLVIPDAVYEELSHGKDKPTIKKITQARWIQRKSVKDRASIKQRRHPSLHLGESEVIALAKEIEADLVIMDDAHARKIAEAEGLKVVGLLAILLDAKRNGIISEIRPLLEALRQQGFFIEDDLYALLLRKAGE